jgi:hypothetical protein
MATISGYPGYTGVAPTGTVTVGAGTAVGTLSVVYSLQGLPPNSVDGVHIHVGLTCSTAGAHYWTPTTSPDPWNTVSWTSDSSGAATGSVIVSTGYPIADNVGHTVVVHAMSGVRVGCGVLQLVAPPTTSPSALPTTTTSTRPTRNGARGGGSVILLEVSLIAVLLLVIAVGVTVFFLGKRRRLRHDAAVASSFSNPLYHIDDSFSNPLYHIDDSGVSPTAADDVDA